MQAFMEKEKKAGREKPDTGNGRTGIPVQLKRRVEKNTGVSLDDVQVHYDSGEPSKLDALAFTRGNQVYIGPGQERHLPHEVGHVVQQKLGMVRPNERHYSGVDMNTDQALEAQADRIGAGQESIGSDRLRELIRRRPHDREEEGEAGESGRSLPLEYRDGAAGGEGPVQRKVGLEFQTYRGEWNIKQLKKGTSPREQQYIENEMAGETLSAESQEKLVPPKKYVNVYENTGSGFQVENDGCDLEYITKAYDEETEMEKLKRAARQAGELHQSIRHGMPCFAEAQLGDYYRMKRGNTTYYINKNGEQTAHPQATVGVEYEKIPDLIERIITAKKRDILYQDVPAANISRRQMQETQRETTEFMRSREDVHNKAMCMAFLQLVQEYIAAANERYKMIGDSLDAGLGTIQPFQDAVCRKIEDVNSIPFLRIDDMHDKGKQGQTRKYLENLCEYEAMFIGDTKTGTQILGRFDRLCSQESDPEKAEKDFQGLCTETNGQIDTIKEAASGVKKEILDVSDKIKGNFESLKRNLERLISPQKEKQEMGERRAPKRYNAIERERKRLKEIAKKYSLLLNCDEIAGKYKAVEEYKLVWFERYFKTSLSVKTRTSFYDLYSKLDNYDKAVVFEYLQKYEGGLISAQYPELDVVTFAQWRKTMQKDDKPRDCLCYELEDGSPNFEKIKGRFDVERSTDIGHDHKGAEGEKVDGALLELRRLKGKIPPSRWEEVAVNICQIINDIHHPGMPESAESGGEPLHRH